MPYGPSGALLGSSLAAESLRTVRIIRLALLAAIFIYALLGELVGPAEKPLGASIYILFAVALMDAGFAVFTRAVIIPRAEDEVRQVPTRSQLWRQWRTAYITFYVVAESVALIGLVLRFLGASFGRIIPFYVIAAALIYFTAPDLPEQA